MIPNSALVTMGETEKTMRDVAAGRKPNGEFAVLREGHFTNVLAMTETDRSVDAFAAMGRFALSAYKQTWDVENIYLGEEFPGIEYLAVHALARRKKRIAMLIHNVSSARRQLPLAKLRLGRLVDHMLCLSEASKQELVRDYGLEPDSITVVGSRVDGDFFVPAPHVEVKRQVCSAGAINRDYDALIAAMEPLGVPTKIAADTQWRYSADEVEHGTLPDFVEMRSWGNYQNLRDLYAESAVVVVPLKVSMASGITVALEAMAMGKPVVLTRNPYVEDFLTDGETGYFVPEGDVDAIRNRVRELLDNPRQAEEIGARARERVLERFTVEQYVDRIMSVWE